VRQPPVGQGLSNHEVSRSHTTTHHIRHDFSGRVISPSQRPLPDITQHSQQTDIHAHGGIRTHNLRRQAAASPRLRPRGDRPKVHNTNNNSRNSNRQYSLFSKKIPFIRIFCVSGWLALPINILDKWSSNICVIIKPRLSGISIYESF